MHAVCHWHLTSFTRLLNSLLPTVCVCVCAAVASDACAAACRGQQRLHWCRCTEAQAGRRSATHRRGTAKGELSMMHAGLVPCNRAPWWQCQLAFRGVVLRIGAPGRPMVGRWCDLSVQFVVLAPLMVHHESLRADLKASGMPVGNVSENNWRCVLLHSHQQLHNQPSGGVQFHSCD